MRDEMDFAFFLFVCLRRSQNGEKVFYRVRWKVIKSDLERIFKNFSFTMKLFIFSGLRISF
jgi:hypothetical protein